MFACVDLYAHIVGRVHGHCESPYYFPCEVGAQKLDFKPLRFCDKDPGAKAAVRVFMKTLPKEHFASVHIHDNVMDYIDQQTQQDITEVMDPDELWQLIEKGGITNQCRCVVHQKDPFQRQQRQQQQEQEQGQDQQQQQQQRRQHKYWGSGGSSVSSSSSSSSSSRSRSSR